MTVSQISMIQSPKDRVFSAASMIAELTKAKPDLKIVHGEVGPSLTKSVVEKHLIQWEKSHQEIPDADELSEECVKAMKLEIERSIVKAAKSLRGDLESMTARRDVLLQENLDLLDQIKAMASEIEILKSQIAEQRGQNIQLQESLATAKAEVDSASRAIDTQVARADQAIEQHRERADKAIEEHRQATSQALDKLAHTEAKLAAIPELKTLSDTIALLLDALAQSRERELWFAERYEELAVDTGRQNPLPSLSEMPS